MAYLAGGKSFQQPKCSNAVLWVGPFEPLWVITAFQLCYGTAKQSALRMKWVCVDKNGNQASKSVFSNAFWFLVFFPPALHPKESFLASEGWIINWGNSGNVPMHVFIFKTAILVWGVVSQVKQEMCSLPCCTQLWQIDVVCPGRKEMLVQKPFPISLNKEQGILFFPLILSAESSAFTLY